MLSAIFLRSPTRPFSKLDILEDGAHSALCLPAAFSPEPPPALVQTSPARSSLGDPVQSCPSTERKQSQRREVASSRPAGTYLGPLLAGWRLQWGRCTEPEGPRHFSPNTVVFQEPEKEGGLDEGTQQVGDRAGTETVASGLLVQCSQVSQRSSRWV